MWSKVFEKRIPRSTTLIWVGGFFGAFLIFALVTGVLLVPGSRGGSTTCIERDQNPVKFFAMIRFLVVMSVGAVGLGLFRFKPVEDPMRALGRAIENAETMNGPSPWWGYLILVGACGLIVYLGWLVMYAN